MGLGREMGGLRGLELEDEGLRWVARPNEAGISILRLILSFDIDGMGGHGGDVIVESASRRATVSLIS